MGGGLDMWRILQVRSVNSLISGMLNDSATVSFLLPMNSFLIYYSQRLHL